VSSNDYVLVQGLKDTRGALERWRRDPGPVLRAWFGWSMLVAAGLLTAVWLVATLTTPDPTPLVIVGISYDPTAGDVASVLGRNSLVLAVRGRLRTREELSGTCVGARRERGRGRDDRRRAILLQQRRGDSADLLLEASCAGALGNREPCVRALRHRRLPYRQHFDQVKRGFGRKATSGRQGCETRARGAKLGL
jgi:hypothetical protein